MYTYVCVYSRAENTQMWTWFHIPVMLRQSWEYNKGPIKKRNAKILNGYTCISFIYNMMQDEWREIETWSELVRRDHGLLEREFEVRNQKTRALSFSFAICSRCVMMKMVILFYETYPNIKIIINPLFTKATVWVICCILYENTL